MKQWLTFTAALLAAAVVQAQASPASGEITKLDAAGARITIKHGEIKNLEMPPMTMVFRVADPRLLEGLAVGQRIGFTAERINGQFTVTSVTKAP
ncbi:MAG: copper-binding protein [Ideonella sp. WA131b]|jgi:Cu/Ag efflux protein CusF|nr:copper-binding protein [Ideonella sp. WA131b]